MAQSLFFPNEALLSHKNNLNQKRRLTDDKDHQALCDNIEERYQAYVSCLLDKDIAAGNLAPAVAAVGEYLNYAKWVEKEYSRFNWRSDYAGSVLPEFIYRVLGQYLAGQQLAPLFSTRDSVVEVSLSGNAGGGWNVRRKNQDLCIGLRHEQVLKNGVEETFVVPLIAIEVKTNIDINKLNGLDFSAERLKRTFPSAYYFLVTETIDFSLDQNYASGSIDEIYVLRKQVRSQARRNKDDLKTDVFVRLVADVSEIVKKSSAALGHVYDRLPTGRLIHVQ